MLAAAGAAIALALSACGHPAPVTSSGTGTASPPSRDQGLVAFETVRSVLQHPRCQNCHPRGDAPLQGDDSHPHIQNVQRGPDGKGMVAMPDINIHEEMVDMITSSRAYEANLAVVKNAHTMAMQDLSIGKH